MATNTEELILRLGFESSAAVAGMQSFTGKVASWGKTIATAISGEVIVSNLKKVIDHFDDLSDKAENLGVGTDFLQGMTKIASSDAVGGVKVFDKAVTELSVRLGSAKNGSEDAIKAFKKFGITIADIKTQDTEGMFYLIADRIKAIPDPAQRTAAAFELLGKAGKNMTGILAGGADQLKRTVDAVDKLDAEKVKKIAAAKAQLEEWGNSITIGIGKIYSIIATSAEGYAYASTGLRTMWKAASEEKIQLIENEKRARQAAIDAEIAAVKMASAVAVEEYGKVAEQSWDIGDKITGLIRKIQGINAEYPTIEELANNPRSPLRKVAKVFLTAQKYQREQRMMGNMAEADRARGWMNAEASILYHYGARPDSPAAQIQAYSQEIATLNKKLADGVIKTQIVGVDDK